MSSWGGSTWSPILPSGGSSESSQATPWFNTEIKKHAPGNPKPQADRSLRRKMREQRKEQEKRIAALQESKSRRSSDKDGLLAAIAASVEDDQLFLEEEEINNNIENRSRGRSLNSSPKHNPSPLGKFQEQPNLVISGSVEKTETYPSIRDPKLSKSPSSFSSFPSESHISNSSCVSSGLDIDQETRINHEYQSLDAMLESQPFIFKAPAKSK